MKQSNAKFLILLITFAFVAFSCGYYCAALEAVDRFSPGKNRLEITSVQSTE